MTYSIFETLDDTLAALWMRKGVTMVIIIVIALFVASLYLNVQFSLSTIEKAEQQIDPALANQAILTIKPDAKITGFTHQILDEIESMPGVISAVEFYEVTLNIRTGDNLGRQTVIKSAEKNDPELRSDRFICGQPFDNDKEIVLEQTLADILGISSPGQRVVVRLERTTYETVEPLEVTFVVSGIIRGEDRCYALTSIVKSFDLWALHATTAFAEENQPNVPAYPHAIGYVEDSRRSDAEAEIKERGLNAKWLGSFYVPHNPKSFWGMVEDPSQFPSEKIFPCFIFQDKTKTRIALHSTDPRWNETPEKNIERLFGSFDSDLPVEFVKLESDAKLSQKPEYHLFIQGKDEWNLWQRYASVTPVFDEGFQHIHVVEISLPGSTTFSPEMVTALNMSKPTFRYVRGGVLVEGNILGTPITLDSASPKDTRGLLFSGRWFTGDATPEIIIGQQEQKLLGELKDVPSKTFPLTISRKNKFGKDESITLSMRIIDSASHSMIPSGLAANMVLWQRGKVIFKNGQFLKLYEFDAQNGTRRAKLVLRSPEDVDAVSKKFAPQGFLVDHKLKLIENIRNLKLNMVVFVLMFCSTSLILCVISLWGYSYIIRAMKKHEFGAMLLMGIPRFCLVSGVIIEGLIYSVAALSLAILLVFLLAAPYQMVLEDVFHIPKGTIQIGLQSTGSVISLLIGGAFAICLGMVAQLPAVGIAWFDKRPQKLQW